MQEVAELCRARDILLLIDEVQTGVGRTGSLFCFQQYGIEPDIVSFAKGIAGGLPMGGFLVREDCREVLGAGTHATTFGGNPICCAGALAVLSQLDDALLADVRDKGEYLRSRLSALPKVRGVRGLGLMLGVAVEGSNKELAARCAEQGLLILTAGDVLRLLPPLTITREEIDRGLSILESVLS